MGGHDWFQVSVSAVGIPAVTGSDSGRDNIGELLSGCSTCMPITPPLLLGCRGLLMPIGRNEVGNDIKVLCP